MANNLMAVMAWETGETFSPKVGTFGKNPDESAKYKYVGLVQFGKAAASEVGTTRTHLMSLTAEEQLYYVEKHFKKKQFEKLLINRTALYLAVNYPNSCIHASNKEYVVYDSTKAAYDDNPMFKREKDESYIKDGKKMYYEGKKGESKVWEFEEALIEVAKNGEKFKAKTFSCGAGNTPINAKDIVTYRIYSDGKIEEHIPKAIKEEYKTKYKYVYHDSESKEHDVCVADWFEIKEKAISTSKLYSKPTHDEIISDENVNDGGTSRRVKYKNGDIAEYGTNDGDTFWRLYKAMKNDIELIKMPESVNYVKYSFSGTQRKYTGPNEFAGFIGALAKTEYSIITTGSCFSEGSCFPSQFHVNGRSVDTSYFWDKEKDQKFIDAMKFFHFGERKVGVKEYFKSLKNASNGGKLHNSHLHSGNFDNTKIKIIKEK